MSKPCPAQAVSGEGQIGSGEGISQPTVDGPDIPRQLRDRTSVLRCSLPSVAHRTAAHTFSDLHMPKPLMYNDTRLSIMHIMRSAVQQSVLQLRGVPGDPHGPLSTGTKPLPLRSSKHRPLQRCSAALYERYRGRHGWRGVITPGHRLLPVDQSPKKQPLAAVAL